MHQQTRSHLYDALKWTLMPSSAKYEMYYDWMYRMYIQINKFTV